MPPLLVARALSKSYVAGHGRCWARVQALVSVSLSVRRGERVVISGPRASGKTTLLHCLTGLRRPDAGWIRWDTSRGAPYRLCGEAPNLAGVAPHEAPLIELPEDPYAAGAWMERLAARGMMSGGWIVLTSRPEPLRALADRVLLLRAGTLDSESAPLPLRVAEGA